MITLSNSNRKIILKCSAKFFPGSLESLADKFDLPKKLDFDHNVSDDDINNYIFKNNAIKYCLNDAYIVIGLMTKLSSILGDDGLKLIDSVLSLSGLSLSLFLTKYNKNSISLKSSLEFDNIIRPSYYGGRCEVFGNPIVGE
jgi:hypothetical protein